MYISASVCDVHVCTVFEIWRGGVCILKSSRVCNCVYAHVRQSVKLSLSRQKSVPKGTKKEHSPPPPPL